jgi:hypothetical protein
MAKTGLVNVLNTIKLKVLASWIEVITFLSG